MATSHIKLGSHIQQLRRDKGLTQDELSDKATLSYSTLAKIERGAIKNPSVFTIAALSDVLGVSIEALLSKIPDMPQASLTQPGKIKFVYCDVNGVLVRFYQHGFVDLARECAVNPEQVETAFWHFNDAVCRGEMTLEELNTALAKHLGVKKVDWKGKYMAAVESIPAMHACLQKIAKDHPIGLLTNIFPGFLKDMVKAGLIPDLPYKAIVDSTEVGAIKPEQHMYEIAEKKAGFSGSEILFIDDSRTNLMAAERFGWHVLWFDDYRPEESVRHVEAALAQ